MRARGCQGVSGHHLEAELHCVRLKRRASLQMTCWDYVAGLLHLQQADRTFCGSGEGMGKYSKEI